MIAGCLLGAFIGELVFGKKELGSSFKSALGSFAGVMAGTGIKLITQKHGDNAFYSISKKEIVLPEFSQFKDGESFYGTAFHEMAHSTGAEEHLNRLKPAAFGSADYAKEELVAELTSAMICQYCGMDKYIKEDSAPYLKSWLESLKEDAQYIKTILLDVKRASAMITKAIEDCSSQAAKAA